MRSYLNPLVKGYAEVFELGKFFSLLTHLLRNKFVEREVQIEYFRDGTAYIEVLDDKVSFSERKKKLVASKFMEFFREKEKEALLKRRYKYIFVWNKNEIDALIDFTEFAIKELVNLKLKLKKLEETIYMEIKEV